MKINELLSNVKDGLVDPIYAFIKLKELEEQLSSAIDVIKPMALDETYKYPEKSIVLHGYEISRKNIVKYVYDGILTIEKIESELKRAKDIAKLGGVHPDTGEFMQAFRTENETIQLKKIKS